MFSLPLFLINLILLLWKRKSATERYSFSESHIHLIKGIAYCSQLLCYPLESMSHWSLTSHCCSGLLVWHAGRYSLLARFPMVEWTHSQWSNYWRVEEDSTNPQIQLAQRKCELQNKYWRYIGYVWKITFLFTILLQLFSHAELLEEWTRGSSTVQWAGVNHLGYFGVYCWICWTCHVTKIKQVILMTPL